MVLCSCYLTFRLHLLQTAFRTKAMEVHPDQNQDDRGKHLLFSMDTVLLIPMLLLPDSHYSLTPRMFGLVQRLQKRSSRRLSSLTKQLNWREKAVQVDANFQCDQIMWERLGSVVTCLVYVISCFRQLDEMVSAVAVEGL